VKPIFDWHSANLSLETRITKSYKNTQNVRRFFKRHLGDHFHFDRPFMQWMKASEGKTLKTALEEWKRHHP
jgi:hypothetical protein